MSTRLKNQIAVIIGGGSWIGKQIANTFAREGAITFIAGPTQSKLEETATEIIRDGYQTTFTVLDIKDPQQVKAFFQKIESQHHKIDIVVNSAGIYPTSTIEKLSLDEWREVIDVNLTGAFIVLKYAAEIMRKAAHGKIIFISSIAGETLGISELAHYGASKAGLNGLMRAAAVELGKFNINVNCISPGNIINVQRFNIDKETLGKMEKHIPLGRTGQPVDVANLALFLASDEASFITGQEYIVDGGEVIN